MQKPQRNPNRISKVNSFIQTILGPILKERLEEEKGLVTISRVETSRDMKWAKVWISILGGDDDRILQAIQKNIYDIQGDVNASFATKIVPRLQFFLDTTPRYAQHIEELIKKTQEEE